MRIPKQCVFSGSSDNLNTSMTVKMDDGSIAEAWVSDEYLNSATPAKVKEAVAALMAIQNTKSQEMMDLIARAKELGLELVPQAQAATTLEPPISKPPISKPPISKPRFTEDFMPSDPQNLVIDGRMADSRQVSANITGSVNAFGSQVSGGGSEYAITSQDTPTEDLKEGEKAEIGRVRGRAGMEVAIPIRRVGKSGETRIEVIDTGGDAGLQRRFKDMAKQSEVAPPHGYQVRTISCSLCRGSGRTMGKACPKCKGGGLIDIDTNA